MRRRADVGLGNVRISDSSGRYYRADALSVELAVRNPSCVAHRGRTLAERCRGGGALNVAAKSIPITGTLPVGASKARPLPAFSWLAAISDYWALTKPEVNFLIAVATLTGFYLAFPGQLVHFPWLRLVHTLLGTLLVASGAGTLNQYIERRFDAQMRRTSRRPLVAGRLKPSAVLCFGIALSSVGSIYLAIAVNALASLLAIVTLVSYLFLYTPLKRKTPLCTLVGAFPGAMPPLIGWAAASGRLSLEAWLIYSMLFLWQFPHFMAIAWMYRDDYARAGYRVLPGYRERRLFAILQAAIPAVLLIPVSLAPWTGREAGNVYLIGATLLGAGFVSLALRFGLQTTNLSARRLLLGSIFYLPLTLVL